MKLPFRHLLFVLMLLSSFNLHARLRGQAAIDSMKSILAVFGSDTNRIALLNNIALEYTNIDADSAMKNVEEALELAKKLNYKSGESRSCYIIGSILLDKGNMNDALKYQKMALSIAEDLDNKRGIGAAYCGIGNVYAYLNDIPNTLTSYFAALKVLEEVGDEGFQSNVLNNIGMIYSNQDKRVEGLSYFKSALEIRRKIGDEKGIASILLNIAGLQMANTEFETALIYLDSAFSIYQTLNDKNKLTECYLTIGNANKELNRNQQALPYYFAGLKLSEELKRTRYIGFFNTEIGLIHLKQKKYALAEGYLDKALDAAHKTEDIGLIMSIDKHLSDVYEQTGRVAKALKCYKAYKALSDSVYSRDHKRKMALGLLQFNFDKKERAMKEAQEKKDILAKTELRRQKVVKNALLGGIVVVLVFSGVLFTQRNKVKSEKKKTDNLLLNILPAEVAEELKAKGTTTAKHYNNVTVLFTDFVNFTKVAELLTPQELIDELHTCFKTFDQITEAYNIEKIKTIGDAYLAVAGLPVYSPQHAANAVNAAIEIRDFMTDRRAKLGEGRTFSVRIGLHTGSVVAGIVGVKKFAYDIWGDAVNTAARLEQESDAGKINISQSTYELIEGKFDCFYRGEIEAKNKGLMKMYYVESKIDNSDITNV